MARKSKPAGKPKPVKRSRKQGRPRKGAEDWAPAFLKAIVGGMHVRDACAEAEIDGCMPYQRRQTDEVFAKAWEEASEIGTRALESEAARRAYHGTLKPVYHQGEEVGLIREYSDQLLMFLLRARRPRKYRDNVTHEHTGDVNVSHSLEEMSDAELAAEINRLGTLASNPTHGGPEGTGSASSAK